MRPDFAQAFGNLGVVYTDLKKYDRALTSYRRALELKPDYAEVYYQMAYVQLMRREYAEARESCARALALRPDYAEAHQELGVIYYASGRKDAALEQYKKLQSLGSPLAGALFRVIYGDKILDARR